MPDWTTHVKIGKIDGINEKIMEEVNKTIDIFHSEKISDINPEHAEWMCCPIVIDAMLEIENPEERKKSVKAGLHHYMLDMIEKTRIIDIKDCNEGLIKLRNHLQTLDPKELSLIPIYGFIERWYFIHVEEDIHKIEQPSKNLAQDLSDFMIGGIIPLSHIPDTPKGYYECLRCGYSCSPERAKEIDYICPKCSDPLHEIK